jgi:hypothetical protein
MEVVFTAISGGIALVSLGVSIVIAVKQSMIAREQTTIQKQQTAIQQQLTAIEQARRVEEVEARGRARVTARLRREQPDHRGRAFRLVLQNDGPAVARRVRAAIEDRPRLPQIYGLEALPVDLQAGQAMKFTAEIGSATTVTTMEVMVRWTDETGSHFVPYTLQTY